MTAAVLLRPPPTTKAPTLGASIDALWALREKKREAAAKLTLLEGEIKTLEDALLVRLDSQETVRSEGKHASVSITTSVVAHVEDWTAFHAYIKRMGYFHLLQKRVSEPAYRELLEKGKKVPGVQPFTARKLNLRSLTT
jgi:hypothetical protein